MKKVILVAATVFAMSSAFASNNNNGPDINNNQTYNQPQGGTASATGGNATGGNATALGGTGIGGDSRANAEAYVANLNNVKTDVNTNVNTSIKNDVKNTNSNVGVNTQGQTATGGSANGVVNTNLTVGGDTYRAAASSVVAAQIPTVTGSCRLYMFGGGTNISGAVSGSIPLGNDQTCLSGVNLKNMDFINSRFPNSFGKASLMDMACKTEGMSEVEECKAAK